MTDCSKIPTLKLVEESKKGMSDIVSFAGSEEDTYQSELDNSEKLTIEGLKNLAIDTVSKSATYILPAVTYSPGYEIVNSENVDIANNKYDLRQVFEYQGGLFVYSLGTETLPYTLPAVFPGEPTFLAANIAVLSVSYSETVSGTGVTQITPTDNGNPYNILGSTTMLVGASPQRYGIDYEVVNNSFVLKGGAEFQDGDEVYLTFNIFAYESQAKTNASDWYYFYNVASMKSGARYSGNVDIPYLCNNGEHVRTRCYHDPVNGGSGEYWFTTLQNYRDTIGDQAWVPNGYRDHYLDGGTEYVAILVAEVDGVEHTAQWGVKYNDEDLTVAAENVLRINAAVEYLCPLPWEGDSDATYFAKNLKQGTLIHPRGFTCVSDTIHMNPGVTHQGVSVAYRPFGKINVFAGVKGSYIKAVGAYKQQYVMDTANWRDATGTRNKDSKVTVTNASADSRLVTWAEGAFLKNLYVVNGGDLNTGGAFFGGVRFCLAMHGGYDGIAISGFDNNLATHNCWNLNTGAIWLENSWMGHILFECTNPKFQGPYTNVPSKTEEIPQRVFDNAPAYFGSLLDGDTWVLPNQHKRQPKGVFTSYCWSPTFEDAVLEFVPNAICSYGNSDAELTFVDLREEANAGAITVDGDTVTNTLVTGWNTYVEFVRLSSLSDAPLHAVGTGGSVLVNDPRKMTGKTFNDEHINIRARANPTRFINWNRLNLPPKMLNTHNVILESSEFIQIYVDAVNGNDDYMGVSPSQPTTLYGFMRGIVSGTDGTNLFRKPHRDRYQLRLTGDQTHVLTGPDAEAGCVNAEIEMLRNGGTPSGTKIYKPGTVAGVLIDGGRLKVEDMVIRNGSSDVPRGENNGVFRFTGGVDFDLPALICDRDNLGSSDQVMFTAVGAASANVTYSGGDMGNIGAAGGLFSVTFSGKLTVIGALSGVNNPKLTPPSIPTTDLQTLVTGV